jgi:hypothetical protein
MSDHNLLPLIDGVDIRLKKGEHISLVRSIITNDVYYTSNLYTKYIDGVEFIGVFLRPGNTERRTVNWMRKDQMVKTKW